MRAELIAVGLLLASATVRADTILTEADELSLDASRQDGRIAMQIGHGLWILPADGGRARRILNADVPIKEPRWAPDGGRILYQAISASGSRLRVVGSDGSGDRPVGDADYHSQDASWHPDGERIVFSSQRRGSGLDIWELDLPTGLAWRVTSQPGDETDPAWSGNGRHLAYVHEGPDGFALMLRRYGEPARVLVSSTDRISSPAWRPDGSLLTYLQYEDSRPSLKMIILSDPPLIRDIAGYESPVDAPVSWRDRMRFVYAGRGGIRVRGFEERRSRPIHFRAVIDSAPPPVMRELPTRELPLTNAPASRLVVRGARLFDGIGSTYRDRVDIVIANGLIESVEDQAPRDDITVLDLGDVTIMPGLIDMWSPLVDDPHIGPRLLAYGVTTIAADPSVLQFDPATWHGENLPGPRLLPIATAEQMASESPPPDVVFVSVSGDGPAPDDTVRSSAVIIADEPATARTHNADAVVGARIAEPGGPVAVSALADAFTPGVAELLASRQALAFDNTKPPDGHPGAPAGTALGSVSVAAGSSRAGFAPGQSLHAELRALVAAGLSPEQTLQAAGRHAARLAGLDNRLGVILPGAAADLLLVRGDPLHDVGDLLEIVAVVRNGRIYSLVSLLESGAPATAVE